MLRCLLPLLWLALAGMASAAAPPVIDLTVTPAWAGWSRPGRATEIDVSLGSTAPTRATVVATAGLQSVRAEAELQPGRMLRLHLPVASAQTVVVEVSAPPASPVRRETTVAQSEWPVLGVAWAGDEPVSLDGFHTVVLAAENLPRHASAFASIDALLLDATTLGALDERQLAALLEHVAACGRLVVVDPDTRLRGVLDSAGRCSNRAQMTAPTRAQAIAALQSSLATNLPTALAPAELSRLVAPAQRTLDHLTLALAACFAVALLTLTLSSALPVLVLTPALAAVALWVSMQVMQAPSQLVVWSEGESGAPVARYQALQQFPGLARERVRVPLPPLLATAARPCDDAQAMRLDMDTNLVQAGFAEFESRLFRRTALCYSGSFPLARTISTTPGADGARELANAGSKAWPPGRLLVTGRVQDLPALAPGARLALAPQGGTPPRDAVERLAMARTAPGNLSALWPLDLTGVPALPANARAWLLVNQPAP